MSFDVKGPIRAGVAMMAVVVGGFGAWALLSAIDGAIVAPATLQVPQNRQIVQHPDGGVVERIAVTDGQAVRAGDLLVRLDGSDLRSRLSIAESQLFEVEARLARLRAERDGNGAPVFPDVLDPSRPEVALLMDGQRTLFAARAETFAAQMSQLTQREAQVRNQIDGLSAQAGANKEQLRLIEEELADQRRLMAEGLTQRARVRAVERERAQLAGEAGKLVAALAEADGRITEYRMQATGLIAQRREEAISQLRDFSPQQAELAETRRALRQQVDRLDIRAPVAGRVLSLAVTTPNSVIRPADPVLWIIPQGEALVAEARIPPVNVDEVQAGQAVRLTLPAFSGREAPEVEGTIVQVSADTLEDKQGVAFYVARIALVPPPGVILTPGMPAEAFIRTGTRSPMDYLLQPFTSYFDKAFRES